MCAQNTPAHQAVTVIDVFPFQYEHKTFSALLQLRDFDLIHLFGFVFTAACL